MTKIGRLFLDYLGGSHGPKKVSALHELMGELGPKMKLRSEDEVQIVVHHAIASAIEKDRKVFGNDVALAEAMERALPSPSKISVGLPFCVASEQTSSDPETEQNLLSAICAEGLEVEELTSQAEQEEWAGLIGYLIGEVSLIDIKSIVCRRLEELLGEFLGAASASGLLAQRSRPMQVETVHEDRSHLALTLYNESSHRLSTEMFLHVLNYCPRGNRSRPDIEQIAYVQKGALAVNRLFEHSDDTLRRQLRSACLTLFRAENSWRSEDRVFLATLALEGLLTEPDNEAQSIQSVLKHSAAAMLGGSSKSRGTTGKLVDAMYAARSVYVHSGRWIFSSSVPEKKRNRVAKSLNDIGFSSLPTASVDLARRIIGIELHRLGSSAALHS